MFYDKNTGVIYECALSKIEKYMLIDSIYYIKYNSEKGLFALEQLYFDEGHDVEENCFKCHIYLDLLMESLGQLYLRFFPPDIAPNEIKKQAEHNCKQFDIDKENILFSSKKFRNFITHIDEKIFPLINGDQYYGTFNMIYNNMSDDLKIPLLNKDKPQGSILDLQNYTYRIFDRDIEFIDIDLSCLRKQLTEINGLSKYLWGKI